MKRFFLTILLVTALTVFFTSCNTKNNTKNIVEAEYCWEITMILEGYESPVTLNGGTTTVWGTVALVDAVLQEMNKKENRFANVTGVSDSVPFVYDKKKTNKSQSECGGK
jgi:hypothetical protein